MTNAQVDAAQTDAIADRNAEIDRLKERIQRKVVIIDAQCSTIERMQTEAEELRRTRAKLQCELAEKNAEIIELKAKLYDALVGNL